ncbi:hypothetical protein EDD85DRAFT_945038 [Armillaria nabsnona]|nr:hypothetical protein EDD85DRAFT_945038 [Armillaria nabsnona]
MLTTPDTSLPCPVDLDSYSFSSDRPQALLLSIPPEILPKAIRLLTTWRLQEPRPALPTASVLVRRAEELDCTHRGRRIKWISKEYYEELEDAGPRITEKANDDQHNEKNTLPSNHDHSHPSQLRRACHIPRTLVSNSIPTIQPIPIPTTHKAIPTSRKTSTKVPISTKKPKPKSRPVTKFKPIIDSENIPPRRRPAAGKSRIPAPAPRVFGWLSNHAAQSDSLPISEGWRLSLSLLPLTRPPTPALPLSLLATYASTPNTQETVTASRPRADVPVERVLHPDFLLDWRGKNLCQSPTWTNISTSPSSRQEPWHDKVAALPVYKDSVYRSQALELALLEDPTFEEMYTGLRGDGWRLRWNRSLKTDWTTGELQTSSTVPIPLIHFRPLMFWVTVHS